MYRQILNFCLILWMVPSFSQEISLTADEWYPVNGDPKSDHPGYAVELATQIWKKAGHEVIYYVKPWSRSISEVRAGTVDCIIAASKSETPDFIFPDEPIGFLQLRFYVLKNSPWRYQDLGSLNKIRLGTMGGYLYDEGPIDQYIKENRATPKIFTSFGNEGLQNLITLLLNQRLDAIIESSIVFEPKIRELGIEDKIIEGGGPEERYAFYIACSPQKTYSAQLVKQLSEGLQNLRTTGELQTLLRQYNVKDWAQSP